jgi:hypothetical protein
VEAETARGSFNLPEGFSVTVPTGRFTLPDGGIFLEGQGVQPTLKVPVDETTALSTDDVVLQAGIDVVLQPLGAGVTPSAPPKVATAADAEAAFSSGAAFLEDLARESYEASTFAQPGTATYNIALTESEPVVWAYVWCSKDPATLAKNLENIQLKFTLDEKQISADDFATYELETGGQTCRLVYTSLSDWTPGEHHIVTTATFASQINDGASDYEPGDYVLDYKVYVKP